MSNPTTNETTYSDGRVEVKDTGTSAGQGVFALCDFEPGDAVIAIEKPLLSALDSDELELNCYNCHKAKGQTSVELGFGFRPLPQWRGNMEPAKLQRCARCKVAWYCSRACQKASWTSHHSLECPIFEKLYPRILSGSARAVLRFVLMDQAKKIPRDEWSMFMMSYCPMGKFMEHNKFEEMRDFKNVAHTISNIIPLKTETSDTKVVFAHLIRLKMNGITLQTPMHDPLGVVMHPLLARINHSCDPNCYVRFLAPNPIPKGSPGANPGEIVVTPLRSIKRGEEITIVYVDETMPVGFRNREFRDQYFFDCHCTKCVREEEELEEMGPSTKEAVLQLQDESRKLLETPIEDFSSSEVRMRKLKGQIGALFKFDKQWPLTRYPFPQILHAMYNQHMEHQDWSMAVRYMALMHFHIDGNQYPSPHHPLRLTHIVLLYKILQQVMFAWAPENPSGPDPASVQLSKEIDVKTCLYMVGGTMVNAIAHTWTEEPWPWIKSEYEQIWTEQIFGPNADIDAMKKRESDRIESLCVQTLEELKRC